MQIQLAQPVQGSCPFAWQLVAQMEQLLTKGSPSSLTELSCHSNALQTLPAWERVEVDVHLVFSLTPLVFWPCYPAAASKL